MTRASGSSRDWTDNLLDICLQMNLQMNKLDRRIAVARMMDWTDAVNFPRGIMCLDRRETPCLLCVAPAFQSAGPFAVDVITCYN